MKKILVVLTALMLFSTSALATSFDDLLWLQNWQNNNNNNSGTVELGDPSMALPALGVLAVAAGAGIIVAEKKRK